MATVLDRARDDHDVYGVIDELINLYHGELLVVELRVGVEFARDPEDVLATPVKMHGLPAVAAVKVVPYRQRVWGMPDVMITIDRNRWLDKTGPQQRALLDDALSYLEVSRDKDGAIKSDDLGRPKINVLEPDYHLTGHVRVLERYGPDAVEALAFRSALEAHPNLLQLVMDFAAADPEPVDDLASVTVTRTGPGLEPRSVTVTGEQFSRLAEQMSNA